MHPNCHEPLQPRNAGSLGEAGQLHRAQSQFLSRTDTCVLPLDSPMSFKHKQPLVVPAATVEPSHEPPHYGYPHHLTTILYVTTLWLRPARAGVTYSHERERISANPWRHLTRNLSNAMPIWGPGREEVEDTFPPYSLSIAFSPFPLFEPLSILPPFLTKWPPPHVSHLQLATASRTQP